MPSDVAALAGVDLGVAKNGLVNLANIVGGDLEVSKDGEAFRCVMLCYVAVRLVTLFLGMNPRRFLIVKKCSSIKYVYILKSCGDPMEACKLLGFGLFTHPLSPQCQSSCVLGSGSSMYDLIGK